MRKAAVPGGGQGTGPCGASSRARREEEERISRKEEEGRRREGGAEGGQRERRAAALSRAGASENSGSRVLVAMKRYRLRREEQPRTREETAPREALLRVEPWSLKDFERALEGEGGEGAAAAAAEEEGGRSERPIPVTTTPVTKTPAREGSRESLAILARKEGEHWEGEHWEGEP